MNEQGRTVPVTYDDMLVEIGRRVPGFAGVYTDPNNKNRSVIALTDLNKAVEAQGAVRDVLGSDFIKPGGVITETAQYDVISLSAWHRALSNSVAVFDQVVYTDMDEYMNRVEIAVLDLSIESEVRAAAKELGIPQEAVVVTLTEPVRLL